MASPSILSSHSKSAPATAGIDAGDAVDPGLQLVEVEGVVQAHHGHPVLATEAKSTDGAAPTRWVGESAVTRSGCSSSMRPQLAQEGVEIGVGDLGRVLLVVLLVVVGDLGPQLLDALGRGPRSTERGPRWSLAAERTGL